MSWRWRLETAQARPVDDPGALGGLAEQTFTSQGDAESWLGEVWRDLLEHGVDQVWLLDGDRVVYGPMSLHTAD